MAFERVKYSELASDVAQRHCLTSSLHKSGAFLQQVNRSNINII